MEVRSTCASFKVIENHSKIPQFCPKPLPKFGPLPSLPDFPDRKCDFLIERAASTAECCGSSAITVCLVLLALLILLIILVLFLRHWKRKLSRVAVDIGNVTGTKKTSTDVKLIRVTVTPTKDSNGVLDGTSMEAPKGTV